MAKTKNNAETGHMELIYLYINDIGRHIKKKGFHFSRTYEAIHEGNILTVQERKDPLPNIYSENIINITALVGKNASGKSTILDLLELTNENLSKVLGLSGENTCSWFAVYGNGSRFFFRGYHYDFKQLKNTENTWSVQNDYSSIHINVSRFPSKKEPFFVDCAYYGQEKIHITFLDHHMVNFRFQYGKLAARMGLCLDLLNQPADNKNKDQEAAECLRKIFQTNPDHLYFEVSLKDNISTSEMDCLRHCLYAEPLPLENNESTNLDKKYTHSSFGITFLENIFFCLLKPTNLLESKTLLEVQESLEVQEFKPRSDQLNIGRFYYEILRESRKFCMPKHNAKPDYFDASYLLENPEQRLHHLRKLLLCFCMKIEQAPLKGSFSLNRKIIEIFKKCWPNYKLILDILHDRRIAPPSSEYPSLAYLQEQNITFPDCFSITADSVHIPLKGIPSDAKKALDDFAHCWDDIKTKGNLIDAEMIPSFETRFPSVSTGEEHFIDLFAFLYYAYRVIDISTNHTILLLLDEPDCFFHPEWSRQFIGALNDILHLSPFNEKNKHEIYYQIVFTTHSPLTLSDIPAKNILCLEQGKDDNGENQITVKETEFGLMSNIYDIMAEPFFMKRYYGEFAYSFWEKLNNDIASEHNSEKDWKDISAKIALIGEPHMRQVMESRMRQRIENPTLQERYAALQAQLDQTKEQLAKIEEQMKKGRQL